jgi:uncharacterized repeat protein (TIGR03803 family)
MSYLVAGLIAPLAAHAVTVTTVYEFKGGTDASVPNGTLLYEAGMLYGVSLRGGAAGNGTVFSVNAATGAEQVLYSFKGGTDGAAPYGALIFLGGKLYGTTSLGGANGDGTVFSVNIKTGAETLLHSFAGSPDGKQPVAGLSYHNGMLYGTTQLGGQSPNGGFGTVFAINPTTGSEQVLYSFFQDGFYPESPVTPLNGSLYGTTISSFSGVQAGTVYKLDLATNAETTVYDFTGKLDGAAPVGGLIYTNGLLYGTTSCLGHSCQTGVYGTVFDINPGTNVLTTLHDFNGLYDGTAPITRLLAYEHTILGISSGTAEGASGTGTVDATLFAVPEAYAGLVTLYTFPGNLSTGLRYDNGAFYGTTSGAVFKLTL